MHLLDQSRQRALTFILAPAGSGKTTLLYQWRERHRSGAIALLRLAPRDNTPGTFFRHLIDSLKHNVPLMDVPTVAPFITGMDFPVDTVATLILQGLEGIDTELFVVLDDFQHIELPAIQQVIYSLLRELPPNVHFILSSRLPPQFSLSWFRLENRLLVVDGDALRMSEGHIAELNRSTGGGLLREDQVVRLANLTEGWVAGVKLALLAYSRSGQAALDAFDGTQPEIVDYFGHVVLEGLCEKTRLFFLHSAIFEQFSAELCDYTFARSDSARIIEALTSQGMFIFALEDKPGWYRYHGLLHSFFQSRLAIEVDPAATAALHTRATDYSLRAGDLEMALAHARQCGDHDYFIQILEIACDAWVRRGDFASILQWLETVPEERLIERLSLTVPLMFALIFSRRFNQAQYYLDLIKENINVYPVWKNTSMGVLELSLQLFQRESEFLTSLDTELLMTPSSHKDIRAFSLVILAYYLLQQGDLPAALSTAYQAKAILSQSGYAYLASYADLTIALCDRLAGHGWDAITSIEKAYARASNKLSTPVWVNIATGMVVVHYELNRLDKAKELCEELLPRVSHACATEIISTVYLTLARLLHLEGNPIRSSRILDQLNRILALGRYERFQSQVAQETMRQALDSGSAKGADRDIADRIARRYGLPEMVEKEFWRHETRYQEAWERYGLTAAYWLTDRGDYAEADRILSQLVFVLEGLGIRSRVIVAACNRAVIRFVRGDRKAAVSAIGKLIKENGLSCFSRSLFDETPGLATVFRFAKAEGSLDAPVLYELFPDLLGPEPGTSRDAAAPPSPKATTAKDRLTSKEREILELLLTGLSNSAISAETGVALSTTKWHLKNIYGKLGVNNRTEAIILARHNP